ncbi:hypothetical protein Tsubulata_010768 [Turnera subulata]|uniref:J domain-containing protein n=1 Tax=Turnera subulata TaxID=218843 RepID=A0A9Q0JJC2_9ROSI|nr:hypothetical protein Tsubulata_010768 [Turnera subulata]
MDESWRMRMGIPTHPRRHSMEAQDPDDFADVFGGPPRSVLHRKFSGDFARSSSSTSSSATSFYEEVFRPPEFVSATTALKGGGGRSLPAFRIPAKGERFYSDVFGAEDGGRRSRERSRPTSKGKSKSNSSSVLSSEELSPLRRPVTGDDAALYSFASKLRPINVPTRWNSVTMRPEEQPRKQGVQTFDDNATSYDYNDSFSGSYYRVSRQVSSPETISLEPHSYRSIKVSVDDIELNSPSSPASSLCQEVPEMKDDIECHPTHLEDEMEHDEDEVMSSYVIEINSDHREGTGEAVSIDEAIAWAKEKYQAQNSVRQHEQEHSPKVEESTSTDESMEQQVSRRGRIQSPAEEELKEWTREPETERSKEAVSNKEHKDCIQKYYFLSTMETELLDEDIRLWSAGKETNIRLLLSTLHHILWPNSGWHEISLTKLIDSTHVKKAYQKARLCLHPDKLQQRGATPPQKYVAEKAFSVLQNAWSAFVSQDVLF